MNRKKRSKIWLMPEEEFRAHAASSRTITELCEKIGVGRQWVRKGAYGNGYYAVRARCDTLGLFVKYHKRKRDRFLVPLEHISRRSGVRSRIKRDDLIPHVCGECGNRGEWQGRKLTLQLHHKNGNGTDHRLENLAYLCPNCHSQTESFAGKNARSKHRPNPVSSNGSDVSL